MLGEGEGEVGRAERGEEGVREGGRESSRGETRKKKVLTDFDEGMHRRFFPVQSNVYFFTSVRLI